MSGLLLATLAPYVGSILTAVAGYFMAYKIHGQPGAPAVPTPGNPVPAGPAVPLPALGGLLGAIAPQLLQGFEQVLLNALSSGAQSFLKSAAQNHLVPALTGADVNQNPLFQPTGTAAPLGK